MKQRFTAVISEEDELYVAQCLEIDVASQVESETIAVSNLGEAIELYLDEPRATALPRVQTFEIKVSGDETCRT